MCNDSKQRAEMMYSLCVYLPWSAEECCIKEVRTEAERFLSADLWIWCRPAPHTSSTLKPVTWSPPAAHTDPAWPSRRYNTFPLTFSWSLWWDLLFALHKWRGLWKWWWFLWLCLIQALRESDREHYRMLVEMASEKYSKSKPLPFGRFKPPMYVQICYFWQLYHRGLKLQFLISLAQPSPLTDRSPLPFVVPLT